jgi:hypothetical protein
MTAFSGESDVEIGSIIFGSRQGETGFRHNTCTRKGETDMAKYTATIDEGTRQRIHALPGRVNFPAFMRKAITIFVEELEKNPDLEPENFVITLTARKDPADKKKK